MAPQIVDAQPGSSSLHLPAVGAPFKAHRDRAILPRNFQVGYTSVLPENIGSNDRLPGTIGRRCRTVYGVVAAQSSGDRQHFKRNEAAGADGYHLSLRI